MEDATVWGCQDHVLVSGPERRAGAVVRQRVRRTVLLEVEIAVLAGRKGVLSVGTVQAEGAVPVAVQLAVVKIVGGIGKAEPGKPEVRVLLDHVLRQVVDLRAVAGRVRVPHCELGILLVGDGQSALDSDSTIAGAVCLVSKTRYVS